MAQTLLSNHCPIPSAAIMAAAEEDFDLDQARPVTSKKLSVVIKSYDLYQKEITILVMNYRSIIILFQHSLIASFNYYIVLIIPGPCFHFLAS